jgi:hypothetical protein
MADKTYTFIEEVCDILNIPVPKISYDTVHFQTQTMMAQCNILNNTIYLRKRTPPTNQTTIFPLRTNYGTCGRYRRTKNFFSDGTGPSGCAVMLTRTTCRVQRTTRTHLRGLS